MKGAEKGVTPVGRYIHRETPCRTCVPLYLMPINEEPFAMFMMCRNALLREADGSPYDIDIKALSSAAMAIGADRKSLFATVNLMRNLIYEELL